MDIRLALELLLMLCLANGVPVVVARVLGGRWGQAVDLGRRCPDGQPVFGPSKTWRGLVCAVVVTGVVGAVLGWGFLAAALFAGAAMAGDLFSSFIKRRLGLPSSSMALVLDQVPESLFPLLLVQGRLALTAGEVLALVGLFLVAELVLSRLAFALHLRDRPY